MSKRYVDLSERVTATYYDCEYEEWSEKTVTVEEVLDTTCDDYTVVEMPSAEPEKGKWITISDGYVDVVKCDQCGKMTDDISNYCPNCGAEMENGNGKTD